MEQWWTFVCRFLCEHVSFLWDKCPRAQLLDHLISAYLVFKKLQGYFLKLLHDFAFPQGLYEFLSILIRLGVIPVFYCSHSDRCVMISHCSFNLHSLMAKDRAFFHVLIDRLYILFGEMSVYVFCLFSNRICFAVQFWGFFIYSRYKFFVKYVVYKYFLPVCSLFFHPLYRVIQSKSF